MTVHDVPSSGFLHSNCSMLIVGEIAGIPH
jgi:hypothetical protein